MHLTNRYDDILREENQRIIELTPGHLTCRVIAAHEIKAVTPPNGRIIDIGCGEGDSLVQLVRHTPTAHIDALDISPEMIRVAADRLPHHSVNFICADALAHLREHTATYDVITASWVVHNFPWPDKKDLFLAIRTALKPGGHLVLFDKIYLDNETENERLLQQQLHRNTAYLTHDVAMQINEHEKEDASPTYRMDEASTRNVLVAGGFEDIRIIDRIERDIVLIARAPKAAIDTTR